MPFEILQEIDETYQEQLPEFPTLDDYLEALLPTIRHYSEDLNEEGFYLEKPWKEITDEEGVFQLILHFFNTDGEYLKSVEGNVSKGHWRQMPKGSNKILMELNESQQVVRSELFDLVYMDDDFMILRKNADAVYQKGRRFLFLINENSVGNVSWKTAVEKLYSDYKGEAGSYNWLLYLVILVIVIILVYSFF